jgi:hypothetical protein
MFLFLRIHDFLAHFPLGKEVIVHTLSVCPSQILVFSGLADCGGLWLDRRLDGPRIWNYAGIFFVGRTGTCPEGLEEFDLFVLHVLCESVCEFCISHFDDTVWENMIKIKRSKVKSESFNFLLENASVGKRADTF